MVVKKIKKGIKSTLDKVGTGVSATIGALGFSQIPGYISHYVQRLGGHLGEASRNVASWQGIADRTTSGSLERLIGTYNGSTVPSVIEAGTKCTEDIARHGYLSKAYEALSNSTVLSKPIDFIKNIDWDIAKGTLSDYVPNIPTTLEGAAYAGVGILAGIVTYCGLKAAVKGVAKGVKKLRKRYRAKKAARAVEGIE